MVRAHQGLPTWHHPNRLWGCVDYHLSNEEPHVFHPDHEEATGNSSLEVGRLNIFGYIIPHTLGMFPQRWLLFS